jgi:hypothetical protein
LPQAPHAPEPDPSPHPPPPPKPPPGSFFFYLARQTDGAVVNWLSAAHEGFVAGPSGDDPFEGASTLGKYIYSLYWWAGGGWWVGLAGWLDG